MALASASKADSGTETQKPVTPALQSKTREEETGAQNNVGKKVQTNKTQKINDTNVLPELLKMADKKSGLFGLKSEQINTNEQEDADNAPGNKLNFFI